MTNSSKVKHWVPNNDDGYFNRMPGDWFYVEDALWMKENAVVIDKFLLALYRMRMITGHILLGNKGVYIDARLPAQHS